MLYTKEDPLIAGDGEIWEDVPEYEELYQVSNIGRVKSLPKSVFNGKGMVKKQESILKPNTLAKGYLQVTLYNGGTRKCFQIHRLVALAFIPNPNNLPQINHKNGNKQDNRVENLEWCNNSTNQLHAWRNGLQKPHYCGGGADRKKRVALLSDDGSIERVFKSIKAASEFLGCSTPANLSHLLNGKGRLKSIYGRKLKFA